MDRRGFLGALAALPIVAKLGIVKEKELINTAPNVIKQISDGSGIIEYSKIHAVACSGTISMCSD